MNVFRLIRLNSLRKKKEKLLNASNLYSTINRKKSDQLYKDAMDIEDKMLKLIEK